MYTYYLIIKITMSGIYVAVVKGHLFLKGKSLKRKETRISVR